MTIKREDLENIDFSDIVNKGAQPIPPTHPGDILLHDFLEPLAMSANALARELRVPANRISKIVIGQRSITGDTALRLSRYFGTTPEFWMNLQKNYELCIARTEIEPKIKKEVQPRAA